MKDIKDTIVFLFRAGKISRQSYKEYEQLLSEDKENIVLAKLRHKKLI